MNDKENDTVQLNVTIELRDLLRANFDAMKAKIVIAVVICVAVMGGFTYLFLLIDEPEMLLKTSPLFFGFPWLCCINSYGDSSAGNLEM